MTRCANLWAVAFDDTGRAALFRDEVAKLGWEQHSLNLLDMAVAVRYPDGTFTVNGELFPCVSEKHDGPLARFLAALALFAPPLSGAAVCPMLANIGATPADVGIGDSFVQEVASLIKPGTSALFVLDEARNMDAILEGIRGLGGTVLKTNVDIEHCKLIQSALSASGGLPQPDAREARSDGPLA
jgi:uncharacterized membrane protein